MNWWPQIAFGTYKLGGSPNESKNEEEINTAIDAAFKYGYRAFDCAEMYQNQKEVGISIRNCMIRYNLTRSDIYIISKVRQPVMYGKESVINSLYQTIDELQCGYIDLFLIHWPIYPPELHLEAYKALEPFTNGFKEDKIHSNQHLINHLGLSNYTIGDYEYLIENNIKIKPYAVQLEVNPWLYRKNTIKYFQDKGLKIQAYRSFLAGGKSNLLNINSNEVNAIVQRFQKDENKIVTPSQVLLRWAIEKGFQPMPKSKTPCRIKENNDLYSFKLNDHDIALLENLTSNEMMQAYKDNYERCIVEGTPLEGTMKGKCKFYD